MATNQIDTSYTNFGFLLDELRTTLHNMHNFVNGVSASDFANNKILSKSILQVNEHLSCIVRDMHDGHVDYTKRSSVVVDITDKDVFMPAFRKTYVTALNAIDDFYLHKLHTPLWVCRHKVAEDKPCWVLSNIGNEVSMLLSTIGSMSTLLAISAQFVQN